jgi:hypothetical protein
VIAQPQQVAIVKCITSRLESGWVIFSNYFRFMHSFQPNFWNDPETVKPLIQEALAWHQEASLKSGGSVKLSLVAKNPCIYDEHLTLTEYYYENPELVPEDEECDDSEEEDDSPVSEEASLD